MSALRVNEAGLSLAFLQARLLIHLVSLYHSTIRIADGECFAICSSSRIAYYRFNNQLQLVVELKV